MKTIFLLSLVTFVSVIVHVNSQTPVNITTSGSIELDYIRDEIKSVPTIRETFKLRAVRMKLWAAALQQQGVHLEDYVAIDNRLNKVTRWNNLWTGNKPQIFSNVQMSKACKIVDDGYKVLEKYQKVANQGGSLAFQSNENPIDFKNQD